MSLGVEGEEGRGGSQSASVGRRDWSEEWRSDGADVLSELFECGALGHLHSLSNIHKDIEGCFWEICVESRHLVQQRDDLESERSVGSFVR